MPVRERDHGSDRLIRRLQGHGTIKIGIIGDDASEPYGTKLGTSSPTVAAIAEFHEFGYGVPRRSWLRDWFDETAFVQDTQKERLKRVAVEVERGGDLGELLEVVGLVMVGEVKERIAAGISPALAQDTIDRKGSSTPLIDTGQLRSSITHLVEVTR